MRLKFTSACAARSNRRRTTAAQSHTALEPHAAVARWIGQDQLVVHASTQACDLLAREIAAYVNLRRDQVQVLCEHVGGAFGAKLRMGWETKAAVQLSKVTGRPVRVVYDRLEELSVAGYRPASELHIRLLADPQGNTEALSAHVYSDGGVSIGSQLQC